jgi:uracil-DNA glycosylase family 4
MNSKLSELKQIHKGVYSCSRCHKFENGTVRYDPKKIPRKTFSKFLHSEIFIVAQSLAKNHVRLSGVPFHDSNCRLSKGGKYLEKHFNTLGYTLVPWTRTKKYVYTTDLVQCFPGRNRNGKGDNIPTSKEIKSCMPWFLKELSVIEPKVILLLGAPATKVFFGFVMRKNINKLKDLYLTNHTFDATTVAISIFVLPHSSSMVKGKTEIFERTFRMIKAKLNPKKAHSTAAKKHLVY